VVKDLFSCRVKKEDWFKKRIKDDLFYEKEHDDEYGMREFEVRSFYYEDFQQQGKT
jgi:hypothetical protein